MGTAIRCMFIHHFILEFPILSLCHPTQIKDSMTRVITECRRLFILPKFNSNRQTEVPILGIRVIMDTTNGTIIMRDMLIQLVGILTMGLSPIIMIGVIEYLTSTRTRQILGTNSTNPEVIITLDTCTRTLTLTLTLKDPWHKHQ